jgi:DNA repair exonuclease SbcCD nuclease subunit
MKFLHAADIHLDSPLIGLSSLGIVPDGVTRHCTRRAFANLIDLAIAQDVAFVIIAGDLYDADWRDYSTGLFFAGEMRRLGRPCFLIRGNHDARSVITKSLVPPQNVREFSSRRTETHILEDLGVALHGRSFPDRAVPEDLSATYPPPEPGRLNIGILHTSAEDPGEHDTYAPCHLSGLIAKRYDYWALGHIHQRQELHPGDPWIVFPGNIQGRHARETGPKGCTLVDVQDGQITAVEHRDTDVLRWASVPVPLDGADSLAEIAARMRFELAAAHDQAAGLPLIARVTLQGATTRHADLAADVQAIDAECRNAAAAVSGSLYIERVRLETRLPPRPLDQDDSAADLERAFREALDDPEIQQRLLSDFAALTAQIPSAPGRERPLLPTTPDALREMAPEAWHIVARALSGDPV